MNTILNNKQTTTYILDFIEFNTLPHVSKLWSDIIFNNKNCSCVEYNKCGYKYHSYVDANLFVVKAPNLAKGQIYELRVGRIPENINIKYFASDYIRPTRYIDDIKLHLHIMEIPDEITIHCRKIDMVIYGATSQSRNVKIHLPNTTQCKFENRNFPYMPIFCIFDNGSLNVYKFKICDGKLVKFSSDNLNCKVIQKNREHIKKNYVFWSVVQLEFVSKT